MHQRTLLLLLIVFCTVLGGRIARADMGFTIAAARRAVESAELKLRLYQREEYPRRLHRLERSIELAEARLASQKRKVKEYEQFDKFKYSSPLFLTLEEARLGVVAIGLELDDLQEERMLLLRYHSDRRRLMELQIEDARARLSQLRAARR